jgi:hypothetical protein
LPETLADLLAECLRADPAERPTTSALVPELEAVYEHETGAAYPNPRPEQGRLLAGELSNRALSMFDLGRPDEAESLWAEALGVDSDHPHTTYDQGVHLWRSGRTTDEELVQRLERVRESSRAGWDLDYLLALVHLERGDVRAARGALARMANEASGSPERVAGREDP